MGNLSFALQKAGLVKPADPPPERGTIEVGMPDTIRIGSELVPLSQFNSIRSFLKTLPKRLIDPSNWPEVFRNAHAVANALKNRDKDHGKLHRFLCTLQGNLLQVEGDSDREEFIRRAVRSF